MELLKGYPLTIIGGICGIVFIILGIWLSKFPPKEINNWFGYRTTQSRKSSKHWQVAQIYAGKLTLVIGCVYIFIGLIPLFFQLTYEIQQLIAISSIAIGVLSLILFTERKLKKL